MATPVSQLKLTAPILGFNRCMHLSLDHYTPQTVQTRALGELLIQHKANHNKESDAKLIGSAMLFIKFMSQMDKNLIFKKELQYPTVTNCKQVNQFEFVECQ